mmetsp:Transcript_8081/g.12707  ORF Transcript_8081/g.12707 Transcript_8081/m.12707 type:complete len:127 (-) Transcript_8081:37-417(-)
MDHRTALMSRRAENMRWEALKVVTRRDGAKKGEELLADAHRADTNVARMVDGKRDSTTAIKPGTGPGPEAGSETAIVGPAMARAHRRAARLAELTSRPVAEPLPSEGAVEGGVSEVLASMAAVSTQ